MRATTVAAAGLIRVSSAAEPANGPSASAPEAASSQSASPPAASSSGIEPVANVRVAWSRRSIRETVCESALTVHAAPPPTLAEIGVAPTG